MAKEKIDLNKYKSCMADYLNNTNRSLKDFFICANPEHQDDHPSMMFNRKNNTVHCFACNATYDIFRLIGIDYKLNKFVEQLNKAQELFGDGEKQIEIKENVVHDNKDYREYYSKCFKNNTKAIEYLQKRGISKETTEKFMIGYDIKKDAIVIPRNNSSYIERKIGNNVAKNRRYKKYGESGLFFNKFTLVHKDEPIFICEGEIDALSFVEAGANVIALGSISNYGKLVKFAKKKHLEKQELIIVLDADDAGSQTLQRLSEELEKNCVLYRTYFLYRESDCKDANDMLVKHRQEFIELVNKAKQPRNLWMFNAPKFGVPDTVYFVAQGVEEAQIKAKTNKSVCFFACKNPIPPEELKKVILDLKAKGVKKVKLIK